MPDDDATQPEKTSWTAGQLEDALVGHTVSIGDGSGDRDLVAIVHKTQHAHLVAAAPDPLEAVEAFVDWFDSEDRGPDYGELARDTHPNGEEIARAWWEGNLEKCDRAHRLGRAALLRAKGKK